MLVIKVHVVYGKSFVRVREVAFGSFVHIPEPLVYRFFVKLHIVENFGVQHKRAVVVEIQFGAFVEELERAY